MVEREKLFPLDSDENLNLALDHQILSQDEQLRLLAIIQPVRKDLINKKPIDSSILQSYQGALEIFTGSFQRMIAKITSPYRRIMPTVDLQQEGNLGLISAIDAFDPTRGQFSTFAYDQIRGRISYALYSHNFLSTSEFTDRQVRRLNEFCQNFFKQEKHNPTHREITQGAGFSTSQIDYYRAVVSLRNRRTLSLDALHAASTPKGNEEENEFFYPESQMTPENILIGKDCRQQLISCINQALPGEDELSWRRRTILLYYFGLYGNRSYSQTELAKCFGLSHQSISQQFGHALKILQAYFKEQGYTLDDFLLNQPEPQTTVTVLG